jgi:type I restriction enzyme R subunit
MSEYLHVEKPFLDQLAALGWEVVDQGCGHVPSDPAASLRTSFRQWLLPEVFREAVRAINLTDSGAPWLTDAQLDDLRDQLLRQPNRTLLEANEAVQQLLFKAQVDVNEVSGEEDPVVCLIDFEHPANNRFTAINQFRVDTPGAIKKCIIPDIVLFVNGMPLAVVECKIGGPTCANPMHEAFVQLLRYRNGRRDTLAAGLREGEPRLFHFNLLLIRTCGERADFGTITAEEGHYFGWKEIWPEALQDYRPPLGVERDQERLVQGMLSRENLLTVLRTGTVFMETDTGQRVKVVCRYQQFRAARRIVERLRQGRQPEERGGVVWHTQGSGKSLTMVFVARMLRTSSDLKDFKIVLVNDRIDLERQLARTAKLIGGRVNIIRNTAELRAHLATDTSDVNMVMVHKFAERQPEMPSMVAEVLSRYGDIPSAETFGVVNPSERIVLMIDEAHRTQKGNESGTGLSDNLLAAFPKAARIAFTGTPLITERHGEKRTVRRFGAYIDTYKLMDAVADGTTLQILYEGKTADAAINEKHAFDTKFEDLFRDRSEQELLAIKKKYGATGDLLEAEQRIAAIAKDLVNHYIDNILPNGFKAQVVCHSKLAAVRYQNYIEAALQERLKADKNHMITDLEAIGQIAFLKTAVVISSDGTNEPAYVTQARRQARQRDAVANFCRPFDRTVPDKVNTGIAFLIVCDMLLTGFDAPIEQVMYIDKKIQEHSLLQAIARVNRVATGKKRGYVVDYIGLANHLTSALSLYAAADEAQELHEGLKSILSELPILEERYNRLIHYFEGLGVGRIRAFVMGELTDAASEVSVVHQAVSRLKDIKARADFEVYLKKFLMSLDIILPNPAADPYRVPAKRFGYLLRMTKERYKDQTLDLGDAGEKVKRLINEHLVSLGINPKIPPVELFADDFLEKLNRHAKGNPEAKASEMEHAIRKHCTVHFDEDPAFFRRLSEKLEHLLQKHRENWDVLTEELTHLRQEAIAGRQDAVQGLDREETTFYEHLAHLVFGGTEVPAAKQDAMKRLAQDTIEILGSSIGIIDFWANPDEQRRLRGILGDALLMMNMPELNHDYERLAVEILKLAKSRHNRILEIKAP